MVSIKTYLLKKYRKELTLNIRFQPNKIFVRNDLFEKIIKSCKETNLECLQIKEKLGLCLYENICDEQELILMSDEVFKEEKITTQHDVKNKQLKQENEKVESIKVEFRKEENEKFKKENEKLKKENEKLKKENEQLRKNNIDVRIKESIENPIEIKSLEEHKNTTDWFDRNKFKEILAIIDSNKFNYRNKIGEFKFIDIRNLVNNIRNKTISEIDAKKHLNTLNKIKNAEIIKHKRHTPKHKELLNLFNDLLDIIITDKTLKSENQEDKNKNENKKVESRKEENEKVESRKEENEKEDEDDYENEDEN